MFKFKVKINSMAFLKDFQIREETFLKVNTFGFSDSDFFFLGFSPYPQSAFIYKCASLALLKSLTVSTGMNVNDIFIQKEME